MINLEGASNQLEAQQSHKVGARRTKIAAALLTVATIGSAAGTYFAIGHVVSFFLYAGMGLTGASAVSTIGTGVGSIVHKKLAESNELSGEELLDIIEKSSESEINDFYASASQQTKDNIIKALLNNDRYKNLSFLLNDASEYQLNYSKAQKALLNCFANDPQTISRNLLYLNNTIVSGIIGQMSQHNLSTLLTDFGQILGSDTLIVNSSYYLRKKETKEGCKERVLQTLILFAPLSNKNDTDINNPITRTRLRIELQTGSIASFKDNLSFIHQHID